MIATEALEKMAENARELGLDYDVKSDHRLMDMPAQQEPVAVVSGYYGGQCVILPIDPARIFNSNTALYTSPPAQRKPLTDEQFKAICNRLSRQGGWDGDGWDLALKEAIEAAHGIKENT